MRLFFVVHGVVQGVGYRHFVRTAALKNQIKGIVRNVRDGSVEIFAEGDADSLKAFEKEINIVVEYGPQVFNIERFEEKDEKFPKNMRKYENFVIENDAN